MPLVKGRATFNPLGVGLQELRKVAVGLAEMRPRYFECLMIAPQSNSNLGIYYLAWGGRILKSPPWN